MTRLDRFATAYIEAALWSSTDPDNNDRPLDAPEYDGKLADETRAAMRADCERFLAANEALIEACEGRTARHDYSYDLWRHAGHDFWLNRCGHGCGFWDGDWPEPEASQLDKASKAFGNVDLYVGDDGMIYAL